MDNPVPLGRSLTFDVLSSVNRVVDPMYSNPSLQAACQVLDQLADLGKALPFIAPAFILLKFIIDIENNARDADVKCQDLLDRITFMLSHLPMLRDVTATEATRQVIDRMNAVLKEAAALINAYRKQGRVARRLAIRNKDKFTACARDINSCIGDLMLSLQIHQTIQLDAIVNREPPVDPEDEAAQRFVASHGGVETVKGSRELVTQFADTLHVAVDDQTMEQLTTDLSEVLHENQANLEKTINEVVGNAVLASFKGLTAQMNEAEKEQKLTCVQCSQEYRESSNGPASCSFHRTSSSEKNYACCGSQHPCQFQAHRPKHHCEYPYSNFFPRAWGVLNYSSTCDHLASVEDTNLETNGTQKSSVSTLLRWTSRGERVEEPTLLIRVGNVGWKEKYFFDTFTSSQLKSLSEVINITHQCTIFKTSPNRKEFAMAEWLLSRDGLINAVRITAKVSTSSLPYITVCPIDIGTCCKSDETVVLSEGGFRSYTPVGEYKIPDTICVSANVPAKAIRPVRTDFKTVAPSTFPVFLKATSDPPLTANPRNAHDDADYFQGVLSVVNKAPMKGGEPLTLESLSAKFRLIGDKYYQPVVSIKTDCVFPVSVEPRQSLHIKFTVEVSRSEEDTSLKISWWNRAYVARYRPLRLKLTATNLDGEEASLVFEYVFDPFPLEQPKPSSERIAFFHFDDADRWSRSHVHVMPSTKKGVVLVIDGIDIKVTKLQQLVWKAIKTGESEIELGAGVTYSDWGWKGWALVDVTCRRVYALKILMTQGKSIADKKYACLGYVACPSYGDVLKNTRQISYATEKVQMPTLPPVPEVEWPIDDELDDYIPPPPPAPASGPAATDSVLLPDIFASFATIESHLSRIAVSLEKLVEISSGLNGHGR